MDSCIRSYAITYKPTPAVRISRKPRRFLVLRLGLCSKVEINHDALTGVFENILISALTIFFWLVL